MSLRTVAASRIQSQSEYTCRQDVINRAVYQAPHVYRQYLAETLAPAEIASLLRYQTKVLGKSVLDIGVGAGRTTRYLAPLAKDYQAVDYSSVMIEYLRRTMPDIPAHLADFRDLSLFRTCRFDFVLAPNNVIDALPPEGRIQALREANRVLAPGGILIFSCHNLRFWKSLDGPSIDWSRNPVRLAASVYAFLAGCWNHAQVGGLREFHEDYALLNDRGHHYACLHYYATRTAVSAQLRAAGFEIRHQFDIHGQILSETSDDTGSPSITYAAERVKDC